jgi:hypothetical protein
MRRLLFAPFAACCATRCSVCQSVPCSATTASCRVDRELSLSASACIEILREGLCMSPFFVWITGHICARRTRVSPEVRTDPSVRDFHVGHVWLESRLGLRLQAPAHGVQHQHTRAAQGGGQELREDGEAAAVLELKHSQQVTQDH